METYDARSDPHLRAFFRRPAVHRTVQRMTAALDEERRPKHFEAFATYMSRSEIQSEYAAVPRRDSQSPPALCFCGVNGGRLCFFCGVSRCADDRIAVNSLDVGCSSRLSGSAAGSRPHSAASLQDYRPPSRTVSSSRPSSAELRARGHGSRSKSSTNTRKENTVALALDLPDYPPPQPQGAHSGGKKVKFAGESIGLISSRSPPPLEQRSRPYSTSNTLSRYLDAMVFKDPISLLHDENGEQRQKFSVVLPPSNGDARREPMVPRPPIPSSSARGRRTPSMTPSAGTGNEVVPKRSVVDDDDDSTTFVLIRFTMKQLRATLRIQRWYRGCHTRRVLSHRKRCAVVIQRAYRRFRRLCSTAVSVWTLQRDHQGTWRPQTQFAQFTSSSHATLRIRNPHPPQPDASEPSRLTSASLLDFHNGTIASLGQLMTLLVAEPQDRLRLLEARDVSHRLLAIHFVRETESLYRSAFEISEITERQEVVAERSRSIRSLQNLRKLLLRESACRDGIVHEVEDVWSTFQKWFQEQSSIILEEQINRRRILSEQSRLVSSTWKQLSFATFASIRRSIEVGEIHLRRDLLNTHAIQQVECIETTDRNIFVRNADATLSTLQHMEKIVRDAIFVSSRIVEQEEADKWFRILLNSVEGEALVDHKKLQEFYFETSNLLHSRAHAEIQLMHVAEAESTARRMIADEYTEALQSITSDFAWPSKSPVLQILEAFVSDVVERAITVQFGEFLFNGEMNARLGILKSENEAFMVMTNEFSQTAIRTSSQIEDDSEFVITPASSALTPVPEALSSP